METYRQKVEDCQGRTVFSAIAIFWLVQKVRCSFVLSDFVVLNAEGASFSCVLQYWW